MGQLKGTAHVTAFSISFEGRTLIRGGSEEEWGEIGGQGDEAQTTTLVDIPLHRIESRSRGSDGVARCVFRAGA